MTKIKISDEEFTNIYRENTIVKAANILNVSEGCINYHADKIGLTKKDIIPGGLPHPENCPEACCSNDLGLPPLNLEIHPDKPNKNGYSGPSVAY